MEVTKAVIPAAGFGTRFLPVTKAQPKEMMPVLDKPTIQYVVEEAVSAGIDDILIITGRGKQAIERHFDKSYELEHELRRSGKDERLNRVQHISEIADIHYIRQKDRNGLGDAVLYAQDHIGDNPFALLLGDTIIRSEVPCTERLIRYAEEYKAPTISLERVPQQNVSSYGIADVNAAQATTSEQDSFQVSNFVEKPSQDAAPSNLAITGRYILPSEIFDHLETIEPGVGDEIQLTDAIRKLDTMRGVELQGDRFDIGTIIDWLQANVEMALEYDDGKMNDAVKQLLQEQLNDG
ncbi:UTP--glucose-1-phosphate uridylyltransferase GalU [Halanaeroarchaeum sulfurireducens]|uniref:UTP--glucose-1-phosphate uridylyltransferase n=1 Tax=Halanaeroarchaeum sulfurireducens TaxID=1604004 RepID=A0A0F7P9H0_9EURY|nr:UTP--glucose-1-phosphate uridylyltransferase GalU [Halanaeroarchaeum sulfurireducens]AKH97432.1 UTP-glucose-1-phosphate uridylyltransferase [Halanaeroarchaeum sulfurireducens]ALG81828.1 UTP-glucose-1-phosphate uridylyltransferase [Halanaeroarchaeum sulfurireducens]